LSSAAKGKAELSGGFPETPLLKINYRNEIRRDFVSR